MGCYRYRIEEPPDKIGSELVVIVDRPHTNHQSCFRHGKYEPNSRRKTVQLLGSSMRRPMKYDEMPVVITMSMSCQLAITHQISIQMMHTYSLKLSNKISFCVMMLTTVAALIKKLQLHRHLLLCRYSLQSAVHTVCGWQ